MRASLSTGLSFEAFKEDRKTFYAVTRALEIISEAARRLPDELRARHPELPWRAIMGAGNVYRHNYDNVLETYVWRDPSRPPAGTGRSRNARDRERVRLPGAGSENGDSVFDICLSPTA